MASPATWRSRCRWPPSSWRSTRRGGPRRRHSCFRCGPRRSWPRRSAWLQARHPGRVGLGVAAGALPLDFEAAGVSQADAVDRFKSELPRLVAMLRGEELGELEGDPALARLPASSGARAQRGGLGGRRRSGRPVRRRHPHGGDVGAGEARPPDPRLRRGRGYGLQGPDPPGVAGPCARRAGRGPAGRLRELRRGASSFGEDQTIASDEPGELAERLAATVREVGADALNLRVQLPGMSPEQVREQIERIGSTVVPSLKKIWP